jgi:hypothetical protein
MALVRLRQLSRPVDPMACELGTWYLLAVQCEDYNFAPQGKGLPIQHVTLYAGICVAVDKNVTLRVETELTLRAEEDLESPDIVCKCVTTAEGTIIRDLHIDDGGCFHCWGCANGLTLHPMTPWILQEVCGLQR